MGVPSYQLLTSLNAYFLSCHVFFFVGLVCLVNLRHKFHESKLVYDYGHEMVVGCLDFVLLVFMCGRHLSYVLER